MPTSSPLYNAWHANLVTELSKPGRTADLARFLVERGMRKDQKSGSVTVSHMKAGTTQVRSEMQMTVSLWLNERAPSLPNWTEGELKARGNKSAGGIARARNLTAERRQAIASMGGMALSHA